MVEGFPIGRIAIPIEPGPDVFLGVDVKVLAELFHDAFVGGRTLGVFGNKVGTFMPRNPFRAILLFLVLVVVVVVVFRLFLLLQLTEFVHQLVIDRPIVLFAKQFRNNDHVVVFQRFVVGFERRRTDLDAQIRTDQSRCWICVPIFWNRV